MNPLNGTSRRVPSPTPSVTDTPTGDSKAASDVPGASRFPPEPASVAATPVTERRASVATGFSDLPQELLEIIAAQASDTLDGARLTLGRLTMAQGHSLERAAASMADGKASQRMANESPAVRRDLLLEAFGRASSATLAEARADFRQFALDRGHTEAQAGAWLDDPETTRHLVRANYLWIHGLQPREWSESLAIDYLNEWGGSLGVVPQGLLTEAVCLAGCAGPHSDWADIGLVPEALRTPALVAATVSRHPAALGMLAESQRTLAVYEAAASGGDLATFSQLPVSQSMAADPGYQALLEGLRKESGTLG